MIERSKRLGAKACAFWVFASAGQIAWGQVVYNDGATHTLPGDPAFTNGQSVSLLNASGLVVNAGASVNGGASSGAQTVNGGAALNAAAGTNTQQTGGTFTGGSATATGIGSTVSPLQATGGTGVISGGAFSATGGVILGGSAAAEGFVARIAATGGTALSLGAGGTLSGVTVTGGDADAGRQGSGGSTETFALGGNAVRVAGSAPVTIASGIFTGGDGYAASFDFGVGSSTGQGGVALDLRGPAPVLINGGTFRGGNGIGLVTFTTAPGTGIGGGAVRVTGPANLTINSGDFQSGSAGAGTVLPTQPVTTAESALTVVGDAQSGDVRLTINGGSFAGLHGLATLGTSPNAAVARIDIFGGNFVGGTGLADLSLANGAVLTTIYGSDFLLNGNPVPLGPVTAFAGTLSGELASGASFEWTFERLNNAPLILAVPEPTTLTLAGVAAFVLLRRRVRGDDIRSF